MFAWVKNFLKYRQYLRFYQSLGSLKFQSYSTTTGLISKIIGKGLLSYAVSTFSCSRSIINFFESFGNGNTPTFLPPIRGILFTGLLSIGLDQLQASEDLNPGLVECEGFRYPFSIDVKYLNYDEHQPIYRGTLNFSLNIVLSYIAVLYTLNLLLTLKSV